MSEIELPAEYQEKGWKGSILDENGKIDIAKTLKKLDNQESLLGKRHIPGKDASDEEWREFASKMTADYSEADYEPVLNGLETKSEAIAKLKASGLTPKQAKAVAEIAMAEKVKSVEKKYSVEDFQAALLEKLPNEKDRAKAKAVLSKVGLWESTVEAANDEALRNIIAAAKIGVAYDVDVVAGKTAGEPSVTQGNGKGANNQAYIDRCFELAKTMPREEAVKQARAEFSVIYE